MIHKLIQFRRIAIQGTRNFLRNAWLSTAASAIMVVTLTVILSAVIINMALSDTIDDIAKNVTVSVYFQEETSESRRNDLRNALEANQEVVSSVTFIDKNQALALFAEQNRDDPTILSGLEVTDNVLPESFEIEIRDLSRISEVEAIANSDAFADIVDETSVSEERRKSIDNIARAQDFITMASIGIAGIFAMISVLVIFNTIRMAIFTRSQEIQIMKLIGARPWYIRGPFLFEAGLYGFLAGIVSSVVVYSGLMSLGPRANRQLLIEDTIDFFSTNWPWVMLATILAGIAIGLISSLVSMSRYLRLKHW